jgi:hypothetical protein
MILLLLNYVSTYMDSHIDEYSRVSDLNEIYTEYYMLINLYDHAFKMINFDLSFIQSTDYVGPESDSHRNF